MIETKNLQRSFKNGDVETLVLKGIDFTAGDGEFIAIMGRSGAGKSTFLYQMSLLDEPTGGEIKIDGHNTHTMSENERMKFRLNMFGYVFQDYALLPELTAVENVALPPPMQNHPKKSRRPRGPPPRSGVQGWAAVCTTCPASFPAASSSASPYRAPSPTSRKYFLPTSRPPT